MALVRVRPRRVLELDCGILRHGVFPARFARARGADDAGAEWFRDATLNYVQHALRHERPDEDALLHLSERRPLAALSWPELARQVRVLATRMRALGIQPGDRVVAYLPNTAEPIVAMLATASIGAVWSSCGPDFGTRGVLDRYAQLAPEMIFCVDGYS